MDFLGALFHFIIRWIVILVLLALLLLGYGLDRLDRYMGWGKYEQPVKTQPVKHKK